MLAHVSRQRSLHWFLPASASLLAAAVLAAGALLALTGRFGQAMAPLPAAAPAGPASGAQHIVALGDSITQGAGDDRGGYAARIAEALRGPGEAPGAAGRNDPGKVVLFTNLAVAGLETGEVLAGLSAPEARRQIEEADLILISAAGNDLSHGLRGRGGPASAEGAASPEGPARDDSPFPPEATLQQAQRNLGKILTELRSRNPRATVRLLGLYNPFEVAPADARAARTQLRAWNAAIEAAAEPFDNVIVVPIADLFAARPELLAGDRYHPGPRGHELIAERVLATLPPRRP